MSLSSLPNEIFHAILVPTVQVRGVKRALRLRLVSQSWSSMVLDAIFDADILADPGLAPWLSCFWARYITCRIMRLERQQLSRPLRIIRQVAERVLASRGERPVGDALREYVFEISQIPTRINRAFQDYKAWLEVPQQDEQEGLANGVVPQDDEAFRQTLLAAAAYTDEIALVRELFPATRDAPYLIYHDGRRTANAILGYPLDLAAFKGNIAVTRLLLEHIAESDTGGRGDSAVVHYASEGNKLGTLEVGLEYGKHHGALISNMHSTTNVDVFKRLLDFGYKYFNTHHRLRVGIPDDMLFRSFAPGSFDHAAQTGEIPLMEYLLQLGMSPNGWLDDKPEAYNNFISKAAENGHYSAVAYLLEKGVKIGSRSIEAAAKHGSHRIVQLLLTRNKKGAEGLGRALLQAVKRENEPIFRLLVNNGARMDKDTKERALRFATEEGLESMVELMREYG
ncbi:ankyrin [Hypomontagnella monticulosa]|nr:ankyrin [Hypomontagnella monticulosa]